MGDYENFDELLTWFEGGYLLEDSDIDVSDKEERDDDYDPESESYYLDKSGKEVKLDDKEAEKTVDAKKTKNEKNKDDEDKDDDDEDDEDKDDEDSKKTKQTKKEESK